MRTRTGATILLAALLVLLPTALALAGGGGGEGGHGGGHGASLKEHGYYLINFLVFLGLVYILAGDKIKAAVRDRSRSVGKEIRDAGAILDGARQREDAAKTVLDGMPARAEEIQQTFDAEGARLAQNIQARSETEKAKILSASHATADAEHVAMRRTLAKELAAKTLDEAETLISNRKATMNHERLFEGFISGLEAGGEGE